MKYYIIAGEASGDLHASGVIKGLKKLDKEAEFRSWGGDLMEAAGAEVVKHYRELAFMGFVEVLLNLRTIRRNLIHCKHDILAYQPDALILVDYPGFNLRMASFAHSKGIPVYYYISPQVWAWKKSRVHQIQKTVKRMFVILPFEKDFYARYGFDVTYVGHPLLDAIARFRERSVDEKTESDIAADKRPVVGILPGSRRQEIALILPQMLEMTKRFRDVRFILAEAPSIPAQFYDTFCDGYTVERVRNQTYELLSKAHAAMVASGTASLETALFGVPQVICYKGNPVSFAIARRIVKIPYIGLPNLILDKPVVRELIQHDFTPDKLAQELDRLLHDHSYRSGILSSYMALTNLLEGPGAGQRTAEGIWEDLQAQV